MPLWFVKKWARALRQSSRAWNDLRLDCRKERASHQLFSRLLWVEQRCSLTTAATFWIGSDTAEVVSAVLTKLPAVKRLIFSDKFTSAFRMEPFCSLLPCPHLTHLYIGIGELCQGQLNLLAQLKHLQNLNVKEMHEGMASLC